LNIKQLKQTAEELFSKRTQYLMLLQELAENFYPQRADFTTIREPGDEWADNIMDSYPLLASRDLGDQVGMMLRPTDKEWFKIVPEDEERENLEAKRFLEWMTKIQRRAMYHPKTKFDRATKEADRDFATFGQSVISVQLNRLKTGLLYRCWHLRDVAWKENEEGDVGFIVRKWDDATNLELTRIFPGRCNEKVELKAKDKPFEKVKIYHIICDAEMYDDDAKGKPYFSIYYDRDNDHIIEAIPVYNSEYVIPRWQTVSGSQYAYSPAAIAALPDARMIQAMTYTLLEAGEKAVNPPLVATTDAVRSDINVYAGGVTWADMEYDERLGQALRPLSQDTSGIPLGIEMSQAAQMKIHQAFYLNKLTLPQRAPEMTAYEVGQRIQEYIRGALPIFQPMEAEYNGALCEKTFEVLVRANAFGSMMDMPPSLQGADVRFKFESPLHDAIEEQKGQKFIESQQLLAEAAALDQSAPLIMDAKVALRDVLTGINTPAEWIRDEQAVAKIERQQEQQAQIAQTLAAMEQGAGIAEKLGNVETAGG
jgi:hypothetical protein